MELVISMWSSMASWLTPTVLFCVLNLMIATIFITSSLKPQKKQDPHDHRHHDSFAPQLFRAPSLLERVKSIKLPSIYRSEQSPFPAETHYTALNEEEDEHVVGEDDEGSAESAYVGRSASDTYVQLQGMKNKNNKTLKVMKKWASEKNPPSAAASLANKQDAERRRPATVREKVGGDEAVDEKADDFINRFRQQLKLQRLDSILRYKEMVNRGAGR